jgi:threonine dehydratase
MQFSREAIQSAQRTVYSAMPPTPQYCWPLLKQALGFEVWVKHENHTPLGAFKVRGGLTYVDWLRRTQPDARHLVSATRGNHGQSIGFAARQHGLQATIVVPHGNSVEKNAAMRALGVELVEYGQDFQESAEHAAVLAQQGKLHGVPSYHPELVRGVSTAYVEFFEALRDTPPDVLYVPIGLGSGITGASIARSYCGVKTQLIGVVSSLAPAYQKSFQSGMPIDAPATTAIADGMACRSAVPQALEVIHARLRMSSASATKKSRARCASSTRPLTTLPKAPAQPPLQPRLSSVIDGPASESASCCLEGMSMPPCLLGC